jgi:uncharacterized protein (DUF1778 family)
MAAMATKKTPTRDEMVMFRAKTEERDLLFEAAESLGMSFSTWARMTLLKEARKLKKQE